jgi:hypothetical protein
MLRRSSFAVVAVVMAMLALAAPALAGGWAVVTLDALPKEARAGQALQLGFMVRQHGKTPTNIDLDGKPLKPVVTARKQAAEAASGTLVFVSAGAAATAKGEDTVRVVARQEGATGHYVADLTFPSDGVWEWQIDVPTFYVQTAPNGDEGSALLLAPLTVLPAAAPAVAPQPAPPEPAAPTLLGLSPATVRWGGMVLLLAAAGVAVAAQRGVFGRRRAAETR